MVVAYLTHLRCVHVEDTVVVSLAILGKDFVQLLRGLVAVGGTCLFSHLDTTVGHECTLQWFVGLQSYNGFQVLCLLTDVGSRISSHRTDHLCLHVENTTLGTLLLLQFLQLSPKNVGCLRWSGKKRIVTIVRRVVILNKISYIDFIEPLYALEASPLFVHKCDKFNIN